MEMASPIKFVESADKGDKWSMIQMGIQEGKSKKNNISIAGMPEVLATPETIVTISPSTTLKLEASTGKPVKLIITPNPAEATVGPIQQVEDHEFMQELENSFDEEITTENRYNIYPHFIIDGPTICPAGKQIDHRGKCRKVIE